MSDHISGSERSGSARPGAVLLDFHNTVAVPRSIDGWIDEARNRVTGNHAVPARARIRNVWADARKLFPTQAWDLDSAAHRHAFISTLSHDGAVSLDLAEALYEVMPDQWVMNDGASDFITRASGEGTRLAIVSNIALDIRPALERWGIASALDAVILSYEVGYVKPDPRIFQLAADSLGVDPTDCLMIGDSEHDDVGGAVLGMQCLIARPDQMWRAFAFANAW
jgi:HAD superfamily hydrolase (TIGR01509 family)